MPFIEVKTRARIDRRLAESILKKGTITAVITTGVISTSAKKLFDDAKIAWAENIPEQQFINIEGLEV